MTPAPARHEIFSRMMQLAQKSFFLHRTKVEAIANVNPPKPKLRWKRAGDRLRGDSESVDVYSVAEFIDP